MSVGVIKDLRTKAEDSTLSSRVCLFAVEQKKAKTEGKRCHSKTMMNRKSLKYIPNMYRLGDRTRRRKDEGKSS
jgi:uncharacterized lipoprotein NlpE involved in copper resistance